MTKASMRGVALCLLGLSAVSNWESTGAQRLSLHREFYRMQTIVRDLTLKSMVIEASQNDFDYGVAPKDYGVDQVKLTAIIQRVLHELHLDSLATKERFLNKTHLNIISQYIRGEYTRPEVADIGFRIIDGRSSTIPKMRKHLSLASLSFVAVAESHLNPAAESSAGAVGYWQLIKDTAEQYNLEFEPVDQRKDLVLSTKVANTYLEDLNQNFNSINGDWALTLSAYNMGPGRLNRLRKSCGKDKDYWQLRGCKGMPAETKYYLHRILAAAYAAEYLECADIGQLIYP